MSEQEPAKLPLVARARDMAATMRGSKFLTDSVKFAWDLEECADLIEEQSTENAELAARVKELEGENEELRGALELIENLHIPDQPGAYGGDELQWAQRHVSNLRRIAADALIYKEH
jgi:hypothetical protein